MAKVKDTKKSFGRSIKAYREDRKLSIKELAHETGYPADLLEKVEKDETTPPVALVLQLSRTLKFDVSSLDDAKNKKASSRVKSQKKRAGILRIHTTHEIRFRQASWRIPCNDRAKYSS